jgi:site-specific DNA-methyltransferase (adenine-specific)
VTGTPLSLFGPAPSELVPVYHEAGIELYHGRCEDILPFLPNPVDAVMADLPYATTRNTWDRPIEPKILWHLYHQLARPTTPVVLFGSGRFSARMIVSNEDEFRYDLVWDKEAVTGHLNAKRQPLRAHEDLLVFYQRQPHYDPQMVYTGRSSHSRGKRVDRTINHYGAFTNTPVADQDGYQYPRSILAFKRPKGGQHPTQKPVALMEWLIRSYTKPGDLVLDNVCGSATTLAAARNCGRRAIGIEMHDPYIEAAVARLKSGATGDRW